MMHHKCFAVTMSLILASYVFMSVKAYNFPPDPPPYIVNQNIRVAVSSTLPVKTVFINVTKYAPQQFLKNITIEFCEPITTTTSLIISLLNDKPPNLYAPTDICVLQYYYIRTYVELEDKIKNVVMIFAVDKFAIKSRDIEVEALTVYQSFGQELKKCHAEKVITGSHVYLNVSTSGLKYFAVAGTASYFQKTILIIVAATVIITAIVVFIFRKSKLRLVIKKSLEEFTWIIKRT
jgi:hypothetical protein